MAVQTVGEMVHGHAFNSQSTTWDHRTICMTVVGGTNDHPEYCGRVYDEHAIRPPLGRAELDLEPAVPNRYGFHEGHKMGCGVLTELSGVCNCGALDWNVSLLMYLAQRQLAMVDDYLQPGSGFRSIGQVSSTEFRTSYAGLEVPTDVTVNGRVIGRWVPSQPSTPPETPLEKAMASGRHLSEDVWRGVEPLPPE